MVFIEVERTVVTLRKYAVGKKIKDIETVEDTIVYSGVNHQEFASLSLLIGQKSNLQRIY